MDDTCLAVVADDREKGSGVIEALAAKDDVSLTVTRLSLGDYRVDGELCVERKTLPDLAGSIADGRLFRQASRLASAPTRAQRLLAAFGSVEAVMTAPVEALTQVEGIGPKTAQSVRWAVEEASVRYAPSLGGETKGAGPRLCPGAAAPHSRTGSSPYQFRPEPPSEPASYT